MGSKKGVKRGPYKESALKPSGRVICDYCKKSYECRPILLHHMKSVHMKKRFECALCQKKFISMSVCNRHMRTVHKIHDPKQFPRNCSPLTSSSDNSFEPDTSFPWMANSISLQESKKFGVHIKAKRDISVGESLVETKGFVSLKYLSSVKCRCFQCGKMGRIKFKCEHCIDLYFCSEKCRNNKDHRDMCNTDFSADDCYLVRMVTKILTIALSLTDIKSLMDFCGAIILHGKNTKNLRPPYSAYAEILRLKGKSDPMSLNIANRAIKIIRSKPEFNLPETQEFKRLFTKIALRHATSIGLNVFSENIELNHGLSTHYVLHDSLSRFNHSCTPKLHHFFDEDDVVHCVALRPIKKGEQVFINYLVGMKFNCVQDRRKYIEETWGFSCKCEICAEKNNTQPDAELDDSYQYIMNNYQHNSFADKVKMQSECIKFLNKYGDTWSTEVMFVQSCYIDLINSS